MTPKTPLSFLGDSLVFCEFILEHTASRSVWVLGTLHLHLALTTTLPGLSAEARLPLHAHLSVGRL